METTYNEPTAINALIRVLSDVVRAGKESPAFTEGEDFVDISDGGTYQPIILLDREDVESLIPFLEDNFADDKLIDYFRELQKTASSENKQG